MKRFSFLVLAAATGCKSELNPEFCAAHPTDNRCAEAASNDAGTDATRDATDASTVTCLGTGTLKVCLAAAPTTPISITGQTLNANGPFCATDQPIGWMEGGQNKACFVVGTDIMLNSAIPLRGGVPIVFVATGTITINATIADSAKRGGTMLPAGFDATAPDCPAAISAPVANASGGGGGAGGGLGASGAPGGAGQGNVSAGGKAGLPAITILHGGCVGQNGADGTAAASGGLGGAGGGAVYFLAGGDIALGANAQIHANGAAGLGGLPEAGGGGGGAGGMIVLWAGNAITIGTNVKLSANGGGGASGATNNAGTQGMDPNPDMPLLPAAGGTLGGAGAGGAGAAGTTDPVGGGGLNNGGGGGGGGPGIIYTNRDLGAAIISPTSQPIP